MKILGTELTEVPFAPAFSWHVSLVRNISADGGYHRKLISPGRDFARTYIAGSGSEPLPLTIPIEGGGKLLKNVKDYGALRISEHGKWRRLHLHALEAAYGKSPFFIHLLPMLKRVYESDISSLSEFNFAIESTLCSFLLGDISPSFLLQALRENPSVRKRGEEIARQIDTNLSLIDALMRFGNSAVMALLYQAENG